MNHHHFMQVALAAAERQAGQTWPNPTVGAALAVRGQLRGVAATAQGGRPHAETQLLAEAGAAARGGTLYVTLEPCLHDGSTPSCAQAIIDAGIAEVVIACEDHDPRTAGKASAMLEAAGIAVTIGVCAEQAAWQHRGFFMRMQQGRPWVTLKLATSMDGMVATSSGESQWITSEPARLHGHRLRAQVDAIISTSRSVAKDDSRLTCRLPGLVGRSPLRVVIDRRLQINMDSALVQDDASRIWLVTHEDGARLTLPPHVELLQLAASANWLEDMLHMLGTRGINHVLVEVGGTFASALLGADLVDEIQWFRAPMVIGADGISAVKGLHREALAQARGWQRRQSKTLGADVLDTLIRERP